MRLNLLSEYEHKCAIKEAKILKEQKHPNVVECFDIFEDSFGGSQCLMILLEYCPVN